jgi:hypothetical protein
MIARKLLLFVLLTGALVGLPHAGRLLSNLPLAVPLSWRDQEEERRRSAALAADRKLLLESMKVTQQVRADLVAGRLSLRQALFALKAEDARRPPYLRRRSSLSGRTPQERYARGLVEQLNREARYNLVPQARLGEIEKELEQYLAEEERNARAGRR